MLWRQAVGNALKFISQSWSIVISGVLASTTVSFTAFTEAAGFCITTCRSTS